METFFTTILIVLVIAFLIGWIITFKKLNSNQKYHIERICKSDSQLAKLTQRYENLHRASVHLEKQNIHLSNRLDEEKFEVRTLEAKLDKQKSDFISSSRAEYKLIDNLKEKLRIEKANHTRFRNRDRKNQKIIRAMEDQLKALNIKFDGFKLIDKKETPMFYLINTDQNKCDCQLPNEGLGGICTKCKKRVK